MKERRSGYLLDGFRVFFFPEKVFRIALGREELFPVLISVFFSSGLFTALAAYVFKLSKPDVVLLPSIEFLIIIFVYSATVILAAGLGWFQDFVLSLIRVKGSSLRSAALENFICRILVLPFWLFILYGYITYVPLRHNAQGAIILVLIGLRLLDIEARLLKTVYDLTRKQGYVIIGAGLLFLSAGGFLGWLISPAGRACLR